MLYVLSSLSKPLLGPTRRADYFPLDQLAWANGERVIAGPDGSIRKGIESRVAGTDQDLRDPARAQAQTSAISAIENKEELAWAAREQAIELQKDQELVTSGIRVEILDVQPGSFVTYWFSEESRDRSRERTRGGESSLTIASARSASIPTTSEARRPTIGRRFDCSSRERKQGISVKYPPTPPATKSRQKYTSSSSKTRGKSTGTRDQRVLNPLSSTRQGHRHDRRSLQPSPSPHRRQRATQSCPRACLLGKGDELDPHTGDTPRRTRLLRPRPRTIFLPTPRHAKKKKTRTHPKMNLRKSTRYPSQSLPKIRALEPTSLTMNKGVPQRRVARRDEPPRRR